MHAPQFAHYPHQGEIGLLAVVEPVDRAPDPGGTQIELVHHQSRRPDLVLADPAIDLGEVPHAHEQCADELL